MWTTLLLVTTLCATPPNPPPRIVVGVCNDCVKLIRHIKPRYPPEARKRRIQGVVRFEALITKTGTVEVLEVRSGHRLLVPAARAAVRRWRYTVTKLNGEPVEIKTMVDVNFSLAQ